jgi:hypothetical protein
MTTTDAPKATRKPRHLLIFAVAAIVTLIIGGSAYVYFYPGLLYGALEKAVTKNGLGTGSAIPINTLYTVPTLASPSTAKSNVLIDGTNHDTLYSVGVLDLSKHAELLHVPDMAGRYYAIEFVNPSNGDVIGYVGRRTTGTSSGNLLIEGPGSTAAVPAGTKRIDSASNTVLVIGRVLVKDDSDVSTAYKLSKEITVEPFRS